MSLKYMSLCHSVFLSHSVCQMFSQSASQSGTNSVWINGFLACKRCPLRRLLTPFWSPIKHLLNLLFATPWQQKTYKGRRNNLFLTSFHSLFHNRNVKKTSSSPSKGGECLTDKYGSLKLKYFELWTTTFSNDTNYLAIRIRTIREIRSSMLTS